MARNVKCGVIQLANCIDTKESCEKIRTAMIEAHLPSSRRPPSRACRSSASRRSSTAPTSARRRTRSGTAWPRRSRTAPPPAMMQELAKKHNMVIVVPIYEEEMTGVYYNTAAVIDADGKYLGKYRKNHIPQVAGFWEKFFFKPGNLGYPVFQTRLRARSASTSATTATSRKARARSA